MIAGATCEHPGSTGGWGSSRAEQLMGQRSAVWIRVPAAQHHQHDGGNPARCRSWQEIGQLKNSWEHIDELNALEMALRAEPKPWLLWGGWADRKGTVAMVVFASLAN